MLNAIALYSRMMMLSVRGQMQYRASFLMQSLGQFLMGVMDFLGILVLFDRFESLMEWSLQEVALFYGIIGVGSAISLAGATCYEDFAQLIRTGEFDRVLLRPRSAALQIAGRELTIRRAGRLIQALAVLVWAVYVLDVTWTVPRFLLLLVSIAASACVFAGMFILQATISFWTVETLELVNVCTYGGRETAMYPLTIYRPWFRWFFTFVVPLACVNYFPTVAILGREDVLGTGRVFQYFAPCLGFLFLLVCLWFWRFGVRHYRSTGS